jgi:hypothetical protein
MNLLRRLLEFGCFDGVRVGSPSVLFGGTLSAHTCLLRVVPDLTRDLPEAFSVTIRGDRDRSSFVASGRKDKNIRWDGLPENRRRERAGSKAEFGVYQRSSLCGQVEGTAQCAL